MASSSEWALIPNKEIPPWIRDQHPELWVTAKVAARMYFRRHVVTIKEWIRDGRLEAIGIATYWDGSKWWIRLPRELAPEGSQESA